MMPSDATQCLRAMAAEIGGRRGRTWISLARRIESGEPIESIRRDAAADAVMLDAIAEFDVDPANEDTHVIAMTRHARCMSIRRELSIVLVLGGVYLVAALWVGRSLLLMTAELRDTFDFVSLNWWMAPKDFGAYAMSADFARWLSSLFLVGLVVVLVAMVSGWFRLHRRTPAWHEWVWSCCPWLGPAIDRLDFAQWLDALQLAVAADRSLPEALHGAGEAVRRSRLQRGSDDAAAVIRSGGNMDTAMREIPVHHGWLDAWMPMMVDPVTRQPTGDRLAAAAAQAHDTTTRETARTLVIVPTFLMIVAFFLAGVAVFLSTAQLLEVLSWLT